MSEQPPIIPQGNVPENAGVAFLSRHRFIVLLVAAILISLVLTAVSLAIYNSSGAAQLDLSRPGYRSVSDQVEQDTTFKEFSSSGPIDKDTLQQFLQQYDERAAKAKAVDAFSGDPLNAKTLEFNNPTDTDS